MLKKHKNKLNSWSFRDYKKNPYFSTNKEKESEQRKIQNNLSQSSEMHVTCGAR